jgi:hypothetical protein
MYDFNGMKRDMKAFRYVKQMPDLSGSYSCPLVSHSLVLLSVLPQTLTQPTMWYHLLAHPYSSGSLSPRRPTRCCQSAGARLVNPTWWSLELPR